uniref:Uncharacterized protein n=1 Tax=Grammatophora oceanica TaxID=210454 RepID=A0A7S1Y1T8_9STRA
MLLSFLYASIIISFLIDSNQGVLQYLNSFQLRILFFMMIGVGSGSLVLLKAMDDPFQGPFSMRLAAKQLDFFNELLESDIETALDEVSGPSSLISTKERDEDRPNYNTKNTLYFHLLTGPWASTVKVTSEVVTWAFRKTSMVWRWATRPLRQSRGDNVDGQGTVQEEL